MSKGKMFVISGASGVGKSTVLKQVMDGRDDLKFSVSATTRAPRPGETDGVHYYFVTKARFEEMIRENAFLEYDAHAGNYYGTPRAQAEEKMEQGRGADLHHAAVPGGAGAPSAQPGRYLGGTDQNASGTGVLGNGAAKLVRLHRR